MRSAFALAALATFGGCTWVLGVDGTDEARPARITVRAEGVLQPVTVRLTGTAVDEMLVISGDGDAAFEALVSPVYAVTLVGGPACALDANAAGVVAGDDITIDLACAGVTRLTALEVETITGMQPVVGAGTSYVLDVSELQQFTRIRATPRSPRSTVTIQGAVVTPGLASSPIALTSGANAITLVVDHPLSEALRTTYTVSIGRGATLAHAAFGVAYPQTYDLMGWSVGTDGERYISGAPTEDSATNPANPSDAGAPGSGAAYVFARQGTGWSLDGALKAPNAQANDLFGNAVAISGDRAVVGAPFEDSGTTNLSDDSVSSAGAAYVFRRDSGGWVFEGYLKSPHPHVNGYFGWSVAIDGDTIVVGAYGEDQYAGSTRTLTASGQAHVFQRSGTTWALQQSLGAELASGDGDGLGFAVAIQGDRIVAGAITAHRTVALAGAARIFSRTGTTWNLEAQVEASDPSGNDYFGASVALDRDSVVIGASAPVTPGGNQVSDRPGAAYVFERAGGTWAQHQKLGASNADPDDEFGRSVAIAGDLVVVSALQEAEPGTGVGAPTNTNTAPNAGAVYVFQRGGTSWTQTRYVKGPDTEQDDNFGSSIAMSPRGVLVVGSPGDDSNGSAPTDNSIAGAGACYVLH